jgi:hypothetical protein
MTTTTIATGPPKLVFLLVLLFVTELFVVEV